MSLDRILERKVMICKMLVTLCNEYIAVHESVAGISYITACKGKVKIWWEEETHKIPVYECN